MYVFKKEDFHHVEGLGNREVICTEPVEIVEVIRVEDPVAEMKKLGVELKFINLSVPEDLEKWEKRMV